MSNTHSLPWYLELKINPQDRSKRKILPKPLINIECFTKSNCKTSKIHTISIFFWGLPPDPWISSIPPLCSLLRDRSDWGRLLTPPCLQPRMWLLAARTPWVANKHFFSAGNTVYPDFLAGKHMAQSLDGPECWGSSGSKNHQGSAWKHHQSFQELGIGALHIKLRATGGTKTRTPGGEVCDPLDHGRGVSCKNRGYLGYTRLIADTTEFHNLSSGKRIMKHHASCIPSFSDNHGTDTPKSIIRILIMIRIIQVIEKTSRTHMGLCKKSG